jgi:hypothetical protein
LGEINMHLPPQHSLSTFALVASLAACMKQADFSSAAGLHAAWDRSFINLFQMNVNFRDNLEVMSGLDCHGPQEN